MLELIKSRNLEDEGAMSVDAPPLVKRLPVWRLMAKRRGRSIPQRVPANAAIVLAVFFVAVAVWTAVEFHMFRSDAPKAAIPAPSTKVQAAQLDAMVKEILERPLFSSDRSPAPEPPSPEALAALQPPVLKSHLMGITIVGDQRRAVFVSDAKEYRSLKEGEDIDGFKVLSIAADTVTLTSSFGQQMVRPSKGVVEMVRNTKPVDLGSFDPDKPGGK